MATQTVEGVHQYLEVSTRHVTEREVRTLRSSTDDLPVCANYPHGVWLWVPEDDDPAVERERAARHPNVHRLLCLARDTGCRYVDLDQDADAIAGLPTYDW